MGSRLNILAGALFIIWLVEFFGYNAGQDVHILLLLSIILFLVKMLIRLPIKEKSIGFKEDHKLVA